MKKLFSLFLALALLLSLTGCVHSDLTLQATEGSTPFSFEISTSDETTTSPDALTTATPEQTDFVTFPNEDKPDAVTQATAQQEQRPDTTTSTPPSASETPTTQAPTEAPAPSTTAKPSNGLDRNGSYTTKNDVALYIRTYGKLPPNFITKSQAKSLYGWKSGSLEKVAPGKCIGGDRFYNNEGLLPAGYTYYECDIDTLGNRSSRGSKRLVFTYSGIIYYTSDHYESFTLLYGNP